MKWSSQEMITLSFESMIKILNLKLQKLFQIVGLPFEFGTYSIIFFIDKFIRVICVCYMADSTCVEKHSLRSKFGTWCTSAKWKGLNGLLFAFLSQIFIADGNPKLHDDVAMVGITKILVQDKCFLRRVSSRLDNHIDLRFVVIHELLKTLFFFLT